jgi:Fe-S-cluster-containing dehydrogenase component
MSSDKPDAGFDPARRKFLGGAVTATAAVGGATATPAWGGSTFMDAMGAFFQDHYLRMSDEEIADALGRIERRAQRQHGVDITCKDTPAQPGVVFGYALNISKCQGYRDCVSACVRENNQGRDSQLQYIRVLEMPQGSRDIEKSEHYYDPETVPVEGSYYMPVQCMQCDDPPCVKACPGGGDLEGARWHRRRRLRLVHRLPLLHDRLPLLGPAFQLARTRDPPLKSSTRTRTIWATVPRPRGVVEKCHFCTQRTREGRQPACQEACPTGARVFGNLLDPDSEIRYVLENKAVFRLKEELGTEPKFWYFTD